MRVLKQELRCGQNSGGVQILMHALEPVKRYDIVTPVRVSGGTLAVRKLLDTDTGAAFIAGHDQEEFKGDLEVYTWMLAPEGHPTTWAGHLVGVAVEGGVLLRPPVLAVPVVAESTSDEPALADEPKPRKPRKPAEPLAPQE